MNFAMQESIEEECERGKEMDKIKIENLQVFANHGVFPEENVLGQKFMISAILFSDTREAGKTDDLTKSINYGEISQIIYKYVQEHTFQLLEKVAEGLAEELLLSTDRLQKVQLEIKKPWAPVGLPLDTVAVEIERTWHTAYIALGANMGDEQNYLDNAVKEMNEIPCCNVSKVSSFIVTEPYGGVEQNDFLNGCLELQTLLTPEELLHELHKIEQAAGRERTIHWGPRTLDLDIIMYDDLCYSSETLCIPHLEMHKRSFVLEPLKEIAPYLRHPVYGKTIVELLEEIR